MASHDERPAHHRPSGSTEREPQSPLADAQEEKDDQVLKREGLEEELMEEDESEEGEQIADAQDE